MRHTLKKQQEACLETLCERQEKTMCSSCVAHRFSSIKSIYLPDCIGAGVFFFAGADCFFDQFHDR